MYIMVWSNRSPVCQVDVEELLTFSFKNIKVAYAFGECSSAIDALSEWFGHTTLVVLCTSIILASVLLSTFLDLLFEQARIEWHAFHLYNHLRPPLPFLNFLVSAPLSSSSHYSTL